MDLKQILSDHLLWLNGQGGSRANLQGANLRSANLQDANLQDANLQDANLQGANLQGANLRSANLRSANLRSADLRGANLRGADLQNADLQNADLRSADLRGADLQGANLRSADLRSADLQGATNIPALAAAQCLVPPESGPFDAWKKCRSGVLVRLRIPEHAARSSATGRKCRASEALVLDVIGADEGISKHDPSVRYRKGATMKPDSWNEDRWTECGGGIHFFMTRAEAEAYE